jgi:hypothetical protein
MFVRFWMVGNLKISCLIGPRTDILLAYSLIEKKGIHQLIEKWVTYRPSVIRSLGHLPDDR